MNSRAPLLLALAFLLLAHASAAWRSTSLALLAGGVLGLILSLPLRKRAGLFSLSLVAVLAVLLMLYLTERAFLPLMLPPVVFTALAGLYFLRSLRPGHLPLIERIVRATNAGELPEPGVAAYARHLTQAWSALLLGLAALNLLLALLAQPGGLLLAFGLNPPVGVPLAWWSVFANGINYMLIGGFFVAEYAYRRHRFAHVRQRSFGDFLTAVGRLGPQFWRGS